MESMNSLSVVILGAGNLAYHFALALKETGHRVVQVYNRTPERGTILASRLGTKFTGELDDLEKGADLYFFCLGDDAISQVLGMRTWSGMNLVHMAGSVNMDVFAGCTSNYGVLYPVQTFTMDRHLDFYAVPLCIEASSTGFGNVLCALGESLSRKVVYMNSADRKNLHLAAVILSNFSNYMNIVAHEYTKSRSIPFDLLKPLLIETATKAHDLEDPSQGQTGPARRGNLKVIRDHINLLEDMPDLQNLYTFVSKSILLHFHPGREEFIRDL
jgi:predicted short-subunit dehydrogenase-like oxidoreductase (DUF2520 family)